MSRRIRGDGVRPGAPDRRSIPRRWAIPKAGALGALALLAACTRNADDKANADKGPAMWAVTDADSTIYLFGTFHVLPEDLQWTTPAFDAAMKETPTTITEVDTRDPAAQARMGELVRELGLNPPGVTLSALLGPVRAVRFSAVVERYDLPMAMFETMRPWLAMISLSVAIMEKEGYSGDSGAEETILDRAATEGDAISHLETAEYQIRALASLDEAEILADFDASLQEFEDFDDYTRRVVGAWSKGDIKALEKDVIADMRRNAPDAFRILMTTRNENWVREIKSMMAGDKDYFIAVGAGHLVGAGSVVDLLQKEGFTVKRVQ